MDQSQGDAILSRPKRGFTVQASPFNEVKLDLAVILVMAVVLLLIQGKLTENALLQLVTLAGYGLLAMLWLMLRTRRISRRLAQQQAATGQHGEE